MTPTNKLRFIERSVWVSKKAVNAYGHEGAFSEHVKKTILQQWWEDTWTEFDPDKNLSVHKGKGEWRDIPLEEET